MQVADKVKTYVINNGPRWFWRSVERLFFVLERWAHWLSQKFLTLSIWLQMWAINANQIKK